MQIPSRVTDAGGGQKTLRLHPLNLVMIFQETLHHPKIGGEMNRKKRGERCERVCISVKT